MDEKDKKDYELAVLVKTEEDLVPVAAMVRQHNGELLFEPRAKKLALAYPIKKNKEAIFAYCTVRALSADAKNLEHDLNVQPEILRFLLIAGVPEPSGERPPMPFGGPKRRVRTVRPMTAPDSKPSAPKPLSNEALEKKIEEILQ